MNIRHAFYVEHNRARGTFNDFKMIEALTPVRTAGGSGAAASWKDYDEAALKESIQALNRELDGKAAPVQDLMENL